MIKKKYRSCDGCVACCIHLPFTAGEIVVGIKPPHVPCPRLNSDMNGCSVYEERPTPCCKYMCLWALQDKRLSKEMRPDKSGFMVHIKPAPGKIGKSSLAFTETEPGGFQRNMSVIYSFLAQKRWKMAVLVYYNGHETWYSLPYRPL